MNSIEIKEAIDSGKSVWQVIGGESYELDLSKHTDRFINTKDEYLYMDENCVPRYCPLKDLYKSKAQADHYLHHSNVTRIYKLPFLTWEEFKEKKVIKFRSADNIDCMLHLVDNGDKIALLAYCVKYFKATEENFYKVYDKMAELFREKEC